MSDNVLWCFDHSKQGGKIEHTRQHTLPTRLSGISFFDKTTTIFNNIRPGGIVCGTNRSSPQQHKVVWISAIADKGFAPLTLTKSIRRLLDHGYLQSAAYVLLLESEESTLHMMILSVNPLRTLYNTYLVIVPQISA